MVLKLRQSPAVQDVVGLDQTAADGRCLITVFNVYRIVYIFKMHGHHKVSMVGSMVKIKLLVVCPVAVVSNIVGGEL